MRGVGAGPQGLKTGFGTGSRGFEGKEVRGLSYTALYRKYRPSGFSGVIGQDHIVRTLKNQITTGRVSHAYLFCGTRGTGKTSVAKIFAKAINCMENKDGDPCGECEVCRNIAAGRSINVIEIDAASNNGVDNVREIREEVMYPPTEGRYKVYIIDEVHMLSTGAFNALLKTLEEPPKHVIFILATTDPQKVPVTILSRCQRFDFRRIALSESVECIKGYLAEEGVEADDEALRYICMLGDGSMRDSLSLLDQCISFYYGERITLDKVLKVSGNVDNSVYFKMTDAVRNGDTKLALDTVAYIVEEGRDISQFVTGFIGHLRNLLVAKTSGGGVPLDMSRENFDRYKAQAEGISAEELIFFIKDLSAFLNDIKYSSNERVMLEVELIKLAEGSYSGGMEAVLARIGNLERDIKNGMVAVKTVAVEKAEKEEKPVPKRKPASSEDVKDAVSRWKEITKGADTITKGTLNMLEAKGGDNDEIMLVGEKIGYINAVKTRLEEIKALLNAEYDKDFDIKFILKKDYEAEFTDAEEDNEFASLVESYFPEADFE